MSDDPLTSPIRQRRFPSAPSRPPRPSAMINADRRSSMETHPFAVDELRRHDACPDLFILERKGADDLLALMLETALVQSECNQLVKLGRPGDRGDVAAPVAFDLFAPRKQNRPAAQALARLETFDTDKTPALGRFKIGPLAQFAPDIGFARVCHFAQAQIVERVAVVELKPGDMAFFDPERRQRLEAVSLDAERRCRLQDMLPQGNAIVRGDIGFIGKLAREAQSDKP